MRTIFCRKYQKELPGLEKAPFPNALGENIYENVSDKAWRDWQAYQVMLINEKRLSMAKIEDRQFIMAQMKRFLSDESVESITGYVPVDNA